MIKKRNLRNQSFGGNKALNIHTVSTDDLPQEVSSDYKIDNVVNSIDININSADYLGSSIEGSKGNIFIRYETDGSETSDLQIHSLEYNNTSVSANEETFKTTNSTNPSIMLGNTTYNKEFHEDTNNWTDITIGSKNGQWNKFIGDRTTEDTGYNVGDIIAFNPKRHLPGDTDRQGFPYEINEPLNSRAKPTKWSVYNEVPADYTGPTGGGWKFHNNPYGGDYDLPAGIGPNNPELPLHSYAWADFEYPRREQTGTDSLGDPIYERPTNITKNPFMQLEKINVNEYKGKILNHKLIY